MQQWKKLTVYIHKKLIKFKQELFPYIEHIVSQVKLRHLEYDFWRKWETNNDNKNNNQNDIQRNEQKCPK